MLTGAILATARAFGETAPLLLVGAATGYFSSPSGRGVLEVLQGSYTAWPTQIFAWARLPASTWSAHTSAAIVVLLVAILLVNAAAIVLRNRYERKW
jgi:phosphate transport system permease protein